VLLEQPRINGSLSVSYHLLNSIYFWVNCIASTTYWCANKKILEYISTDYALAAMCDHDRGGAEPDYFNLLFFSML